MHTTKDSQTFLYVERSSKDENSYLVEGWVASERGEIQTLSLKDSDLQVEFIDRPDVSDFYPNVVSPKGFQLLIQDPKADIFINLMDGLKVEVGNLYRGIIRTSGFMNELYKDVIVVDDFYADPDAVRDFAMNNLEFKPSNYHKGQRATERFILDGTKEKLEEVMGCKIKN